MKKSLAIIILALFSVVTVKGQRTENYSNGDKYVGMFNNNSEKHGKGTYYWANGDRYEGDWKNNKHTGKGTYYYANGDRYEGDWKNGERTGKGTYYYANGNRYEGDFVDNQCTGKGTCYYANGNRYEGDFVDNQCTGKGTCYYANGNRYEGDCVDGEFHGKGTYYWSDGARYKGDWKNGKRHGKGILYWPDGALCYEGDFVDDKRTGRGKKYNDDGSIDIGIFKDNKYLGIDPEMPFSEYAESAIVPKINEWQKKGEFEKTAEWQVRVNELTRQEKIAELVKQAENTYIEKVVKNTLSLELGSYDADNEVYLIRNDGSNLLVPVPIAEAQSFKSNWASIKKTPKYFIENDRLAVSEVAFEMPNGKTYKYSNAASLNYTVAQVDYNFDPIEIPKEGIGTAQRPQGQQTISTVNVTVGKADVDTDIPRGSATNDNTFAVIIANENYKRVDNVEFALNDGEIFRRYCIETLGMPKSNVEYYPDATKNDMLAALEWLAGVSRHYNGEANIILYYVGHGVPDEATGDAYLLPSDGIGNNTATACKLSRIYETLGNMSAKTVSVFLDACFSGAQRDGSSLVASRGVALKSKESAPQGNMIVFSAATGTQTAYPYREKQHGLFTYYLLKKLKDTGGNATLGELGAYIADEVGRRSIVVNKKEQTPTISVSATMTDSWKSLKLK